MGCSTANREYGRNILTLLTGATIAQAIPIAFTPVLTRLYVPSDFGVLAIFVSLAAIFGTIANARYEQAIMLPESKDQALAVAALASGIAIIVCVILLIAVYFFNKSICSWLSNDEIGVWLYLLPVSVLLFSLNKVLLYLNSRTKNYHDIARSNVLKSIVLTSAQLILGLSLSGPSGLLVGHVIGGCVGNLRLVKNTFTADDLKRIRLEEITIFARKYSAFPKYSIASSLANSLSRNLTSLLVASLYSTTTLGFYSITQRILGAPSALIGSSVSSVFFQEAVSERQSSGSAIHTLNRTTKHLLLIGVPAFAILLFSVEHVFAYLLGEEWRIAGEYARILTLLFAVRFVVATVATIESVFEKQLAGLFWQLSLLSFAASSIVASSAMGLSFETFLWIASIGLSVLYLAYYAHLRHVAAGMQLG